MLGPLLFLSMTCQRVLIHPCDFLQTTPCFTEYSELQKTRPEYSELQKTIRKLEKWEHKWQMQFNADKCGVLRITNKTNLFICNYNVHDQHLQIVKQAKYLCTTISSDPSWNQHVDNNVKKATNSLNFLRRNIRDCPPQVKEQCYKSLVLSNFGKGP